MIVKFKNDKVDFDQKVDFDEEWWMVRGENIDYIALRDYAREWKELIDLPSGDSFKLVARWSVEDCQLRECKKNGEYVVIATFESPEKAEYACMLSWLADAECNGPSLFKTEEEAEEFTSL